MSLSDWEPQIEYVRYDVDPVEPAFEQQLETIPFEDLNVVGTVVRYQTIKERVISLKVLKDSSPFPIVLGITTKASGGQIVNRGELQGCIDEETGIITPELLIVRHKPLWRVYGEGSKPKTLPPPLFGFQLLPPEA